MSADSNRDGNGGERIHFADVSLYRGPTQILRGVDWRVEAGQNWALIGPNGSGKSTLLRILGCELFPSGGEVRVLGNTFGRTRLQDVRRRIGWVSARLDERLYKDQTTREMVLTGSTGGYRLFDDCPAETVAAADDLLRRVRMSEQADRSYKVLSSGERQRAMLARALLAQPDILALDEPCAGLDLAGRELLLQTLTDLAAEASAPGMVYVTHHVEELFPGISHALLLKEGRVVASGPVDAKLTGAALSSTFDIDVEITKTNGRFTARATYNPAT